VPGRLITVTKMAVRMTGNESSVSIVRRSTGRQRGLISAADDPIVTPIEKRDCGGGEGEATESRVATSRRERLSRPS